MSTFEDRVPETDWEAYWMQRCSELERRCEELWDELVGAFDERDSVRRQRADLMAEVHRLNLEVMAHQVGVGYEKGYEHGMAAGILVPWPGNVPPAFPEGPDDSASR